MEQPTETPPETPPAELTREMTAPDLNDDGPCAGPFSPRQRGLVWDGNVGRAGSDLPDNGRTMSCR